MALSPSASYKSHYQQFTPPFEIPKSWQWVNITEVTSKITDGTHHSPENKPIGDFLYITAKNIKYDGIKKDSATYVNSNVHTEIYSRCNPEYGDILYIKDGATAGVVAINDLKVPFSLLSSVALIKPLGILNRYLYYFLRSDFSNSSIKKSMKGVGITRITLRQIEEWNIPVPPYAEQERIVKILDNYFSILSYLEWNIDTLQESIHNAKSKILDLAMQGKLVPQDPADEPAADMLRRINPEAKIITDNPHSWNIPNGWCWVMVSDVFAPMQRKLPEGDNFWYIDIDSVDNKRNVAYPKNICTTTAPSRASRFTQKGDVVFSMVRPYLRNIALVPEDDCIASTGFYVFHPLDAILSKYSYILTLSSFFVDGLNSFMKGDNSPSINKNNVESFVIPLPPLNEQKRIVAKIEDLYSVLDEIEASLRS
ncbi:restriction endonuclease subunit S [Muribaculaceae bacterium Isolate-001 (NCI)]|nr:restriction endonuclease subunit S [Muribaculaceae bacterium Isolate-001 (NCI)]